MNGEDQFEKRLERIGLRPVPPEWRAEILSAARPASSLYGANAQASPFTPALSPSEGERENTRRPVSQGVMCGGTRGSWRQLVLAVGSRLEMLLWPKPKVWVGLAAVWVLILGLNWTAGESQAPRRVWQGGPPSAQLRELLKQQHELVVELIGEPEKAQADIQKQLPGPRSQIDRRADILVRSDVEWGKSFPAWTQASLRDAMEITTADRGLQPTATFVLPLRGAVLSGCPGGKC